LRQRDQPRVGGERGEMEFRLLRPKPCREFQSDIAVIQVIAPKGDPARPETASSACSPRPTRRSPGSGGGISARGAAFAGVVRDFDRPRDGEHMLIIEQGFEMGRPSLIALGLVIEAGFLAAATIGGSVILIANGSLDL
jgi:hypothetical protein